MRMFRFLLTGGGYLDAPLPDDPQKVSDDMAGSAVYRIDAPSGQVTFIRCAHVTAIIVEPPNPPRAG